MPVLSMPQLLQGRIVCGRIIAPRDRTAALDATKENEFVLEKPAAQSYETSEAVLSYRDIGTGPALLLLHGAAPGETGWASFDSSIDVLREEFRLIVPDLPGFGRSRLVDDTGLPYNAIAAKALTELLAHLEIDKVHVAGNSMGGGITLRMALEYPTRVDRIVLVAPYVRDFCPGPATATAPLLGEYYDPEPSVIKMRELLTALVADVGTIPDFDDAVTSRHERTLLAGMKTASRRLAAGGWVADYETRTPTEWIGTIDKRALVMWGHADRFCPTDEAFHYLAALDHSELIVFPKTGHCVQLERSAEFVSYVAAFLTR